LVPGARIRQAPAHRPGLPQVAPAVQINRICMIVDLSELDCTVVKRVRACLLPRPVASPWQSGPATDKQASALSLGDSRVL